VAGKYSRETFTSELPDANAIWFYEGETFGYRMLQVFFPRQNAVIAFQ
jgi:hypothetical protein